MLQKSRLKIRLVINMMEDDTYGGVLLLVKLKTWIKIWYDL